jgi:hypothetical protein
MRLLPAPHTDAPRALHQLDRSATLHLVGPAAPLDPATCREALTALHGLGTLLSLELHAGPETIETILRCDARHVGVVTRALAGAASGWEIGPYPPFPPPIGRLRRVALLTRPDTSPWVPLKAVAEFPASDPIGGLLEAVQPLGAAEQLLIRYLIRPARPDCRLQALRDLTTPAPPRSLFDLVPLFADRGPRIPRFAASLHRVLERRLTDPAFEVIGAVALAGDDPGRLDSRAWSLDAAFRSLFDAGFGGLQLGAIAERADPTTLPAAWQERSGPLYLTASELSAAWHPPSNRVLIPGVAHLRRPTSVLPPRALAARGVLLGTHRQRGDDLPIHLPVADLQLGHAVLLGRTGTGKSTLQHRLLHQLMDLPERPAVLLLDPHGDLARDVAATVPLTREADTVLLELGDTDFPVGLPLLRRPAGISTEAFIQATVSIVRLIFREHWSPTRMEDAVFALVGTLVHLPAPTLLDAPRLFADPAFRRGAISRVGDPVVREFWADYEALSEAARRELARPILYRLRAFSRTPAVRNLICRTDGLDLGALLERRAIILVSLAGSEIQAEADLLGELLIARLHVALLGRLARPRQERSPVYLAIDESQRFQGASLPILLGESRKLGLALVLSTQHLAAWGEALAESVLGNVGTQIAFRCGPTDSRRLAHSLRPFTPEQLEDLDRFEAIVKLQVDGQTVPAFDLRTTPLAASPDPAMLARIRARTREQHAKPRDEIEQDISTMYSSSSGNAMLRDDSISGNDMPKNAVPVSRNEDDIFYEEEAI